MIITHQIRTEQIGTKTQRDEGKNEKKKISHRSKAKSSRLQDINGAPLTSWILLQNTGSHGNLNLIHKSSSPIQSNLIPWLGQAGQGPLALQPSCHLIPKLLNIICLKKEMKKRK